MILTAVNQYFAGSSFGWLGRRLATTWPRGVWSLSAAGGRLVVERAGGHTNGDAPGSLGAFQFMSHWIFDASASAVGLVDFDGQPLELGVRHLNGSGTVSVSYRGAAPPPAYASHGWANSNTSNARAND